MRIVSLNVWGGAVHDALLSYLRRVDADVYCLQEVPRSRSTAQVLTYRDGPVELEQRANLYDELRAVLPDHDGFYCPTARGTLHDGDREEWQEFGLVTFVRNTVAVIGQSLDFVHGEFSPDGFGAHPRSRNAHCLRLYDYAAGSALTVAQLHGLRDETGKADTPARAAQARALAAVIERIRRPDEPLVVCGDLNLLPRSDTFTYLHERFGLTDLVTSRGVDDTRTSLYRKPGRFADYLLVSPDVTVVDFEVVAAPEVSDHRPLLLTL